jgi:hypothetical protein
MARLRTWIRNQDLLVWRSANHYTVHDLHDRNFAKFRMRSSEVVGLCGIEIRVGYQEEQFPSVF